ncbi:MAG: hypothetical protein KF805_00800 [Phycisphaeraceae bacterium]|nr:hypothetical protein [Phycisphaeraceae bacterium]
MSIKRVAFRVTPLAISLLAGTASGQVVNWTGAAGPNWFDAIQSGNCPNTQLQYFNGFGQIGCGGAVFPSASNFVVVNAGTGPNINGSFTVGGMSNASGATTTWSSGDLNFGNGPGAGLSNSGDFVLPTANDRSILSSTITNDGLFQSSSSGTLYFQTCAFTNNNLLLLDRGTWLNYTGTNSLLNSGEIDKASPDLFTITVATQHEGYLDVQAGTLSLQSTSLTAGNSSDFVVRDGALLNLQNLLIGGTLNGTVSGTGVARLTASTSQSENVTLNVFGAGGMTWADGDWHASANQLLNTGLFTVSGASDRSFFNGTLNNSSVMVFTSPGILYFQTLAFINAPGSDLRFYDGTWRNYTGSNSIVNQGTIHKYGGTTFSTDVASTLAGALRIHQGTMQFNSTSINFQNPVAPIDAGAVLNLNNTTLQGTFAPSLGSGSGCAIFGGSALSNDLTVAAAGASGLSWSGGDWQFNSHQLVNNGLLTVTNTSDRSILQAAVQNNSSFVFTPASILYFQTASFTNAGTLEWQRGTWRNYTGTNALTSTGTIKKTSADPFNLNVATTLTGPLLVQGGTLYCSDIPFDFKPSSSVTASVGTSMVFDHCSFKGKLSASAAGASISLISNSSLNDDLTTQVSGSPGFNHVGGDWSLNGHSLTNTGLYTLSTAADRSVFSGAISNSGTFESDSPGILYFQTLALSNSGMLRWHRGTWTNYTGSNSFSNSGVIEKVDATPFASSVAFAHTGTLHVKAGSVSFNGNPVNATALSYTDTAFGSSLSFNNCLFSGVMPGNSGAPDTMVMNTFRLADNFEASIGGSQGLNWASGEGSFNGHTLTNSGTLSITGGDRSGFSGVLANNATLNIAHSGILYFQTLAFNNGPGATTNWSGGHLINYTGSNSISNQGLFTKTGSDTRTLGPAFTNLGEFAIEQGAANASSFTQDVGATIRTTIYSPTDAGRLNLSSPITLHGNLAIYFQPLFVPASNASWTILTSPTITGMFDTIMPIAFPAGRQVSVAYLPVDHPTSVVVTLLAPGCVADLNHDNQVDDADFVLFVPAYNTLDCADPSMPPGCPADLNGDGFVDDADFQLFVFAYDILLCPE